MKICLICARKGSVGVNKKHLIKYNNSNKSDYKHLNIELQWTKKRQEKDDIIICDDYTINNNGSYQYPGIIKAVDEFSGYDRKIFYGNDGNKKRGYVYFKKH